MDPMSHSTSLNTLTTTFLIKVCEVYTAPIAKPVHRAGVSLVSPVNTSPRQPVRLRLPGPRGHWPDGADERVPWSQWRHGEEGDAALVVPDEPYISIGEFVEREPVELQVIFLAG